MQASEDPTDTKSASHGEFSEHRIRTPATELKSFLAKDFFDGK